MEPCLWPWGEAERLVGGGSQEGPESWALSSGPLLSGLPGLLQRKLLSPSAHPPLMASSPLISMSSPSLPSQGDTKHIKSLPVLRASVAFFTPLWLGHGFLWVRERPATSNSSLPRWARPQAETQQQAAWREPLLLNPRHPSPCEVQPDRWSLTRMHACSGGTRYVWRSTCWSLRDTMWTFLREGLAITDAISQQGFLWWWKCSFCTVQHRATGCRWLLLTWNVASVAEELNSYCTDFKWFEFR